MSADIRPHTFKAIVNHPKPEIGYCAKCLGTVRNDFCKVAAR
jgi:hypothetical protein